MSQITKSRTFAVMLHESTTLTVHFLHKKTTSDNLSTLIHGLVLTEVSVGLKPFTKGLLLQAGLTVRTFDNEEKQWMDESLTYGVVRAPGNRDGSWGMPDLESFETDYLRVM